MVAWGITAPDVSVTAPLSVADSSWARALNGQSASRNASSANMQARPAAKFVRAEVRFGGWLTNCLGLERSESRFISIIAFTPLCEISVEADTRVRIDE
jgi:hypothetical protein